MLTTEDLLEVARTSPVCVGAHDKQRWISLFALGYAIEDPVGSRPVRGKGINDFWDCFIAPNDIRFEVHHEFVAPGPGGGVVVRDVTIRTTMQTGVSVTTPAHLHYTVDSDLKIQRMAAHWEPAPVFAQLLKPRAAQIRSLATMSARMVRHLGLGGTTEFAMAVRSVGRRGKAAVLDHLGDSVQGVHKVIAAADTVSLSCTVDGKPAVVMAQVQRGVVSDVQTFA
ncbi:MAG TPA: nuclear transport factor 2 family protein [Nocardioidaceae bacterium]|nr:nuclear transport factor 2 family protein [Nocardioidaceae bacterium]